MVFTCVFTCFSCCMWSESSKSSLRQRTAGLSRQQSPVFHHRRQRPGGPWRPVVRSVRSVRSNDVSLGGWTGMGLDWTKSCTRFKCPGMSQGTVRSTFRSLRDTQSHSLMLFDVHCLEHCLISPEGRQWSLLNLGKALSSLGHSVEPCLSLDQWKDSVIGKVQNKIKIYLNIL